MMTLNDQELLLALKNNPVLLNTAKELVAEQKRMEQEAKEKRKQEEHQVILMQEIVRSIENANNVGSLLVEIKNRSSDSLVDKFNAFSLVDFAHLVLNVKGKPVPIDEKPAQVVGDERKDQISRAVANLNVFDLSVFKVIRSQENITIREIKKRLYRELETTYTEKCQEYIARDKTNKKLNNVTVQNTLYKLLDKKYITREKDSCCRWKYSTI